MALAGDIGSGILGFQLGFCSNRKAASSLRRASFHAASIMSGGYCGLETLNFVYARFPSSSVDESGGFPMRRSELEGAFEGISESSDDDTTRRRWVGLDTSGELRVRSMGSGDCGPRLMRLRGRESSEGPSTEDSGL
jgi:hypothetical protein